MNTTQTNAWRRYADQHIDDDLEVLQDAIDKMNQYAHSYPGEGLYAEDAVDLAAFKEAAENDQVEWAKTLAGNMDTACREEIPARLYHAVEYYNDPDHENHPMSGKNQ